jgi:predicted MFS family arabinose efflux permease
VNYRPLVWLAVATFSTGIDGYVLAGLLPAIADELDVVAAAAGQLVSVFAFTSALAAPLLSTATSRWERRGTIALSLGVFVLGNLIVGLAPTYSVALGGRVVAALGGCLLNAAVTGYVLALTPAKDHGKALSFVLGGWMAATALGVPVGLVLGQVSWRLPMVLVAVVGSVALLGILLKLPRLHLPAGSLADRLRPLGQPRLLAGLLVTTGILCSSYTCFTYATLILRPAFPAEWMMILVMFGYGLASMLGNAVTGRLVDRFTALKVLTVVLVGLLVDAVLGAVSFGLTGVLAVSGLVWFFVAGVGNGGAAVPQQARLAALALDSAAIVMALNGSAIALGCALGSALGGATLAGGVPAPALPVVAAAILALTLGLHLVVATTRQYETA